MTDGPVGERLFNDKDTAKLNKVKVDILKQFLNTSRFKRANLTVTCLSSAETVHSFPDLPAAHLPRGFGRRAGAGTFTGARERRGSGTTRQRVQGRRSPRRDSGFTCFSFRSASVRFICFFPFCLVHTHAGWSCLPRGLILVQLYNFHLHLQNFLCYFV